MTTARVTMATTSQVEWYGMLLEEGISAAKAMFSYQTAALLNHWLTGIV